MAEHLIDWIEVTAEGSVRAMLPGRRRPRYAILMYRLLRWSVVGTARDRHRAQRTQQEHPGSIVVPVGGQIPRDIYGLRE